NSEQTAVSQNYWYATRLRAADTTNAIHWDFNTSRRVIDIAKNAFASFGVATYEGTGAISIETCMHTDHETDDKVLWTGLGAVTRALAKIIDGVNTLPISEVQASSPENPR